MDSMKERVERNEKKASKKERLTLKLVAGWIRALAGEVREMQRAREVAMVNACADEKEPSPLPTIYRVVTNGKRFAPQESKNDGETWRGIWTVRQETPSGYQEYRTYRGALKFLRKEYGEKAIILSRVWRAV